MPREFARAELVRVVCLFCDDVERLDRWGDVALRLWFVDRALQECGALHRGGHLVSGAVRRRGAA